jgi:anti-anti-sigma factor
MITQTSTRTVEPDITVVTITGRLSLGNTLITIEDSIKKLIQDGVRKLVIDLTELAGTDSSGIGLFVLCAGEMQKSGGAMRIAGAHDSVMKVFEIVHLNRVTPIDADVETACRHLAASAATF